MVESEIKTAIQGAYRAFLSGRELKPRWAQKEMIGAIARQLGSIRQDTDGSRLGERHVVAIEAGTGTGKTVAYLIAAIPIALAREIKLVVSTATVALQEQLINKDLPELREHSELPFTFQIAKGRRRYLCVSRLESMLEQQQDLNQMALYEDEYAQRVGPEELRLYAELLDLFARGQWSGERDELETELSEALWLPLTADHHQCTNRRCPHFSGCPFFRARADLEQADLVVVNHDLLLADLSLGGGAILPEPRDTLYIVDEAHHLSEKATAHFSVSMRFQASDSMLGTIQRQLKELAEPLVETSLIDSIRRSGPPIEELKQGLARWRTYVQESLSVLPPHETRVRFEQGKVDQHHQLHARQLVLLFNRLDPTFERLVGQLREVLDGEYPEIDRELAERWLPVFASHWARLQRMSWLCQSYAREDPEEESPTARWIQRIENDRFEDVELHSAPVSAHSYFRDLLWSECFGAVLTSATLTALGRFDRLFSQLGLPEETAQLRLASPFDYAAHAEFRVPRLSADPSDPEAHTAAVAAWLNDYLKEVSAALVLFTSWRQMNQVSEALEEELKAQVLMQGELTKQSLLAEHRSKIDQSKTSIIFGLASFAEGVDLPGDYLKDVIITKLPFSVPDDPVDATLAEWVEHQGGNAFSQISVPLASMRLTQAAGRLVRTEQDTGRVVLLDRRIVTRRYGRAMLETLPPFKQVIED